MVLSRAASAGLVEPEPIILSETLAVTEPRVSREANAPFGRLVFTQLKWKKSNAFIPLLRAYGVGCFVFRKLQ